MIDLVAFEYVKSKQEKKTGLQAIYYGYVEEWGEWVLGID